MISLIVATDRKGLIGKGDFLPWHLSEDLRYFKEKTMGKYVILGERTFRSLNTSLKGRKVIVLSREMSGKEEKVRVARSRKEALSLTEGEVMVAGGASVYEQFLPLADRIYLTVIDKEYDGDVYFPKINKKEWKVTEEKKGKDSKITFKILERRGE